MGLKRKSISRSESRLSHSRDDDAGKTEKMAAAPATAKCGFSSFKRILKLIS